jgi:hypothetical protein
MNLSYPRHHQLNMQIKLIQTLCLFVIAGAFAACPAPSGPVGNLIGALGQLQSDVNVLLSTFRGLRTITLPNSLKIQQQAQTISSDLRKANQVAGSISSADQCAADGITSSIQKATPAFTSLLQTLASRQGEFKSIGVSSIVQNDLQSFQGLTNSLVDSINSKLSCPQSRNIKGSFDSINNAFKQAITAYGGRVAPPPKAKC